MSEKLQIPGPADGNWHHMPLPLFVAAVSAGFPSPADDYIDRNLDLNQHLIDPPAATYYIRASGNSMTGAGIHNGDLLIVDRAIEPRDGNIVIASIDGELVIKRFHTRKMRVLLKPENDDYPTIEVSPESDFQVWGVCRFSIHAV